MKLDEKAQVVKVAEELLKVGDEVTALGWGITFQQGQPDKLLSARLNVSWVDPQRGLTYTAVGRIRATPIDTCAGDSGGPLLAWREGAWLLYATLRGGGYDCVTDRTSGDGIWNSLAAHSTWLQQFLGSQSVLFSTGGAEEGRAEEGGAEEGEYVEDGDCTSSQFRCENDKCININYICDGDNDCGDRSNERTCDDSASDGSVTSDEREEGENVEEGSCTSSQFRCDNGNCINKNYICDDDNDCGDRSDERNCNGSDAVGEAESA